MLQRSSVITAEVDVKNARILRYGLERAGLVVAAAECAEDLFRLPQLQNQPGGVVIVALSETGPFRPDAVRSLRERSELLVLALGPPQLRSAALAAGASDFLPKPVFLRDVVTMAQLLQLGRTKAGELASHQGLFYVIRALSLAGRTGVLSLVRGLRRGELRFFEGEVTSAQSGSFHGMAALQQLLLWTSGSFELRTENVVRRRQIPLEPGELLDALAQFLRDFAEAAAGIRPQAIYERDLRRVAQCTGRIPREVNPVLRLFDGIRTVSDVIEDSPFGVFETVKVASHLGRLGAIRLLHTPRIRSNAFAALAIDDWKVGAVTPRMGVPVVGECDGEPASPPAEAPLPPVEWGKLPSGAETAWDVPSYAAVVPSQAVVGEIRATRREGVLSEGPRELLHRGDAVVRTDRDQRIADGPAETGGNGASAVSTCSPNFDAIEEAFFQMEHEFAAATALPPESFDDLDRTAIVLEEAPSASEMGDQAGIWRRLFGRPAEAIPELVRLRKTNRSPSGDKDG